jgi:DNA-binding transcriptional MocR family regulator
MAPAGHDLADPRAYRRLAAMIRQQIGDGTLQSGRAAPSITSLSREHGNARQTCSRALRMLEGEGMLSSDRAGCVTVPIYPPCPHRAVVGVSYVLWSGRLR